MTGLVLGNFELIDPMGLMYRTAVLAEGTSRGRPVPIDMAVESWLQNGSIVVTQGYDNRQVQVQVTLRGVDLGALADAEAALFAEIGRPNLLTWTPPGGHGIGTPDYVIGGVAEPSVFEVITSSMDYVEDDLGEIRRGGPVRAYQLNLTCKAFVHSVNEVVAEATGSGTMTSTPTITEVTVDDGTSTTGWSGVWRRIGGIPQAGQGAGNAPATVTVVSDTVAARTGPAWTLPAPAPTGSIRITTTIDLTKTAVSWDVSATKQLEVDWFWDATGHYPDLHTLTAGLTLVVNGTTDLVLIGGSGRPDRLAASTVVFEVPAGLSTITSVQFSAEIQYRGSTVWNDQYQWLHIDAIRRNNAASSVSTPRQLQRTIAVAGSARTQGRVSIEHETVALGDVLAYFWPDTGHSYSPPLRQFRTSGGAVTADAALYSGARDNLVGSTVAFHVPANRVPPGGYVLTARIGGAATTATVSWNATTVLNGVDTGPSINGSRVVPITSAYQILPIGRVTLPTRDLSPSSSAQVRVWLSATVSSGSVAYLDDAWIFNTEIGQLIQVSCGTATPSSGGSSNRVFIRPATLSDPRPTIRVGHLADESDAAHPLALGSWQPLKVAPPYTNVFTAANALDAAVTLHYFPAWHTHAAL